MDSMTGPNRTGAIRRGTRDASLRSRVRRRIWAYGAAAVVVLTVLAVLSAVPMLVGRADVRRVERDDAALQQVLDLRTTFAEFQIFLLPQFAKLSTTATSFDPTEIANGSQIVQTAVSET